MNLFVCPFASLTLNASRSSIELRNEGIKRAPLTLNGIQQFALGQLTTTAALRSQVLPEQTVVDVT